MEIAVGSSRRKKRRAPDYFFSALKTIQSEPTRARHGPKSDPQQFRLYKMEREEIGARDYARLSFAGCKRVTRSVCRAYGVPQPRLMRGKLWAAAEWWKAPGKRYAQITLSTRLKTSHDLLTLLHELGHHIHFYFASAPQDHQDHGPQFMACYISILDTVRFIPRDAMATICQRRKIKYLMPGPTVASLRKVLNQ